MVVARTLETRDYFRLRCAGDPQISPDGTGVVYVVEWKDVEKNKIFSNLWIQKEGKPSRSLTVGEHRDTAPRWSPDSASLVFLSDRSGQNSFWRIEVDGGEARRLRTNEIPSGPAEWSPDGRLLAYTARVFAPDPSWTPYPGALPGDRARAQYQSIKRRDKDTEEEGSDVKVTTRIRYRFDGMGDLGDDREQIFVLAADGASDSRQLTSDECDHQAPLHWSPDGRYVAYAANQREDADLSRETDLWILEVATGLKRQIVQGAGAIATPLWSPQGDALAFTGHDSRHGLSSTAGLWLVELQDPDTAPTVDQRELVCLTRELDRPVGLGGIASDVRVASTSRPIAWTNDGNSVIFLAGDAGATYLFRTDRAGDVQRMWGTPDSVISAFSYADDDRMVMQVGDSAWPEEVGRLNQGELEPISGVNDALRETLWTTHAERFQYVSEDGWPMEGFVYRPQGYQPDRRSPGVLFIHGGPHAAYGQTFLFQAQMLAAQGFTVLLTNPRGSQTYGSDFAHAVVEDWGGDDYLDIMSGIDYALEQGWIDEQRIGVTGWSYGGFMTSWVVAQTDRFRTGIIGAPVTNRHSFYGTSDIGYDFGEHHAGGMPWNRPELLLERSPLSYADRIRTPVLIMHGEGDLRCPVAQSEELFVALRRLGRSAAMVVYPNESHGVRKPQHVLDRYDRILQWFVHHL